MKTAVVTPSGYHFLPVFSCDKLCGIFCGYALSLPVSEKYMLTIKEAAAYFNIGIKKLRRIAEDNLGTVAVYCGNRFLIIRPKFEEFILNSSEI